MKNSFIKKSASLFLALLLLAGALCCLPACEKNGGDETSADEITTGTDVPDVQSIPILLDGIPQVRIIRPDTTSAAVTAACRSIMETLKAIGKETPTFKSDFIKASETHDPEQYEIIVGLTNYDETARVQEGMRYNDYSMTIEGHKIVIMAYSDKYITYLANSFNSYCRKNVSKEGDLYFTADAQIAESVDNALSVLPVYTAMNPSASEPSDAGAFQVMFEKRTADDYAAYLAQLDASGLEKVSSREVQGNKFTTYKNDKYAVSAYYMEKAKIMRVIAEPVENLFTQDENKYTAVTTPRLVMIGDQFDAAEKLSGLECMVLQLSDGRFIIIDGGVASNGFSDKIYNVMVKFSGGNPDVTVAAWFISHSHNDHMGGFVGVMSHYGPHVTVEKMFFNFIDYGVALGIESGAAADMQKVYSTLQTYSPGTKVYKTHTGQVYEIADARVEVLYTADDYLKSSRNLSDTTNYNHTSMIFCVDIAGQRLMFLGDAQNVANDETASAYGDYLLSDIVQIAHHSGVGGTVNIYKATRPIVALVTTDDSRLSLYLPTAFNQQWINDERLMEYWNAHNRITLFELPYVPTEKVGFRK